MTEARYPNFAKGNPRLQAMWHEAEMEYERINKVLWAKSQARVKMRINNIHLPEYIYYLDTLWSDLKPYRKDQSEIRNTVQNLAEDLIVDADRIKKKAYGADFFECDPSQIKKATTLDTILMDLRNDLGMGIPTGVKEGLTDEMVKKYVSGASGQAKPIGGSFNMPGAIDDES